MEIGVNAAFEFSGTPPFTVAWTEQRTGSRKINRSKRFDAHHGEVILQPEHEGQYTYTFTSLSDRHYQQIQLDRSPIQQTVHPLANVDIVGRGDGVKRFKLFSCSGDQIDMDLEAKGTPPLTLNYLKSWGSKLENVTIEIKSGRSRIPIMVPDELGSDSGASGKLSITLVSIQDGDGRSRKLPAPTVRFAKSERAVITQGDNARAPLRLTGIPPWEVSYTVNGGKEKRVTMRDANNHLSLADEGVYRLTKVSV
jgi:nucleoporin POM152